MRIAVLDIGGTFIKSGLYEDGLLHAVQQTPTPKGGGAAILQQATELLSQQGGFDAIGVSTAGQVDVQQGMIRYANENIPGYTGTKIRSRLEATFSVPVAVDNDVNMAALGESCHGAGRDQQNFLCLTYGTGVGGAIVLNGEIFRGACNSAAEFGSVVTHAEAQSAAGGFPGGIYEKFASTTALVRMATQLDPSLDNGRTIFSRLEEPQVSAVVDAWIGEILLGLSSLIHIFNPSCVVLGGGVMEQPYILQQLQARLADYVMPSFLQVALRPAQLGNRAGLLGAAVSAIKRMDV